MIRASKFALALFIALSWLEASAFAQVEGPGGIIYGPDQCDPAAYIAGPNEPSVVDPLLIEQATGRQRWIDEWDLRVEYLQWTFKDSSDTLLGSPVAGVENPRLPQVVVDPFGGAQLGIAIVPDTHLIKLRHNNGFRVTLGAELLYGGRFEVNAFLLEKAEGSFKLFGSPVGDPNQEFDFIATSTFVNDQLAESYFTYNHTFEAVYLSRLWGAGADFFFDVDRQGLMHFMPSIGVRYISLGESLTQTGIFRDTVFGNPPSGTTFSDEVTIIDSKVWNNIAGPQVGFRYQIVHDWFTLGVDPRVGVGVNSYKARVVADNFQGGGDPRLETVDYSTHVALFTDVHAYGKLHINRNLTFQVGYNFLWLTGVSRPADNVYYNVIDDGTGNVRTDVRVRQSRHTFDAEGITVGAELHW